MCICVGLHATVCIWRQEDNCWESDFSSHPVDSGDWTLEVRLDCQVPIPVDPSHLDLLNGNYLIRLQKDRLLSIFWTLYGQVYFREALMCFSFHISVMPAFDWTEIKSFFFFQAACDCGARLWQLDHKSNSSAWQSELPAKWRSAPACRLVKPKDNSVAEISRERVAGQSKPQYKINIPTWLMFHGWFLFVSESLKLIYESDWGHPFFLCSICYLYRVTVTFLNCQRVPVQTPSPKHTLYFKVAQTGITLTLQSKLALNF